MFKWNPRVHFYLRLATLILLSLFLLLDLIMAIYYPQPKFAHLGYGERVSNYYSFFTTQTNYIVALYFFLYLFESKFKNTKPHYIIQLAVTTYITITMLVFWIGIVGQKDQAHQYRPYHWVATIILHLIMPVTMITSYVLTSGDHYYYYEDHHKKYLWLIMLYMVLYLTIILLRGTYRHLDGKDPSTLFPYFFLNCFQPGGDIMVATALVVICVVALSLQYFYIFINNLLYFRYYRNKNVKIVPIQYVMYTNKVTITGFIIVIIVLTFNIGINIFYVISASLHEIVDDRRSIQIIKQYQIDDHVLIAFIFISFLALIGFITCFVFALRGKIGARIAGALLMIALMFFTWIWVVEPIFCLITALIIFNGHEKVTDITLVEAHNLRQLKKTRKAQKKLAK
ncbi:hypothetical protein D6D54_07280 [Spiroplasma poulsonii]|uniref:Transmembrane protein n=2 Tax=Spiroplasma poulsonii TaxID=2138 RepID=A0A3S0ULZ6_9MOLU|nr:hypothetical protein [Spiroplasma poulsonii]RUP75960.1 hypothetical protein D6D54_07280 [Spiroplasma poulsonii]